MIILFFFFIVLSSFVEFKKMYIYYFLRFFIFLLTIIVGFRSFQWPDTSAYAEAFAYYTNDLFSYSINDSISIYSDKGFYFISSIIKTFTSDTTIYFVIISILTFFLLYKNLRTYSIYPLIGLCVYIARFLLSRNMMQIRACLAILIVVYAIKYIMKQDLFKYFLFVILASSLHISMLISFPLYWINRINITNKIVLYSIFLSFIISFLFSSFLSDKIVYYSSMYDIATSYTSEGSEYTVGLGLKNPMIYYQTLLLLLYSFYERKLKSNQPFYRIIRDGYLYSTCILIILSSFGTLSGRLSTIYATFEIFIIPAIIYVFYSMKKYLYISAILMMLFVLFYLNYTSAIERITF